jgi:ABC-type oligopeptide transport system ATPase subunit
MEWDDFLRKNADDFGLSPEQTKVFLLLLSEENQNSKVSEIQKLIEDSFGISASSFSKFRGKILSEFTKSKQNLKGCDSLQTKEPGKLKILREWLKEKFDNENSIIESEETSPVADNEIIDRIDWQNICQKILKKKPLRRNITGNSVELNIFVEVGVNKLIQQQNSNTQEEYYSYDRFFSEVIENNDLGRLAIIGEPGSGKTTLLERIAKFAKTTASIIWIDLQRLGEKSIEEYLRQIWLKSNLDLIDQNLLDPTPELEKELAKLFNSGEVWLILDGVDEMAEKNAIDVLDKIAENITRWLDKARIILSCRQNVWAENLYTMRDFQVYQTLNFSYGDLKEDSQDQVEDFIHKYFSQIEKFDLGLQLRHKLNEIKYQRVKDLVRNPLRLSLLCQCWQLKQGELPQTKAEIYTLFVNSSYDWKAREHSISEEDQEILHQKLGELAKNGIDQDQPIFEFGKKYIVKLIGERFFKLAVDLHWLILIDINVNTNEKIYAFIHKTFQEYFASLVIDDWHFFLNHKTQNLNPFVEFNDQDCVYRIFEFKWREVILLWCSRNDISDDLKNQFVSALQNFNTNYFDIYAGLALKLATEVINEYVNVNEHLVCENRLKNALLQRFGKTYLNSSDYSYLSNVEILAIEALKTNSLKQASKNLINLIDEYLVKASNDEELEILLRIILDFLLEIDRDNPLIRKFLESLLEKVQLPYNIEGWKGLIEIKLSEITQEELKKGSIEQIQLFKESSGYNDNEVNQILDYFSIPQNILNNYSLLNKEIFNLLDIIINSNTPQDSGWNYLKLCHAIQNNKIHFTVVSNIKKITNGHLVSDNSDLFRVCYSFLWLCAKNMSYSEFYRAWHSENLLLMLNNQNNSLKTDQLVLEEKIEDIVIIEESIESITRSRNNFGVKNPKIKNLPCFELLLKHLFHKSYN